MRKIGCAAAMLCGLGMGSGNAAVENNSSLTPLTPLTSGGASQPDFILKECQETESTGDARSAMRAVSPAAMLRNYLRNREKHAIELSLIKNVTLLEDVKKGEMISQTNSSGVVGYWYDPTPEYVGNDRAVFMAEYQGIRYKIEVDLRVFKVVDEYHPVCPPPKLIKVNNPSSGARFSTSYKLSLASVERNNQRAFRRMNFKQPVQCAAFIARYCVADWFFQG